MKVAHEVQTTTKNSGFHGLPFSGLIDKKRTLACMLWVSASCMHKWHKLNSFDLMDQIQTIQSITLFYRCSFCNAGVRAKDILIRWGCVWNELVHTKCVPAMSKGKSGPHGHTQAFMMLNTSRDEHSPVTKQRHLSISSEKQNSSFHQLCLPNLHQGCFPNINTSTQDMWYRGPALIPVVSTFWI